jgi:type I restriction enzyme, S subunit
MSELPEGWVEEHLGHLAEFVMGQAPPGEASNFDGIGTPFVKAGEFGNERPIIREWTTQPLKLAKKSDVLICVVGATSGKINLGDDCAIGRSVAAIRANEVILQSFLFNFLKTRVLSFRQASTGTAQGVISSQMLSNLAVPLPPLAEQERIVTKLDSLLSATARARKELDAIPALIAAQKRALLSAAFTGELTADWRGANNRKKWSRVTVSQIAERTFDGPFGSSLKSDDYVDEGIRVVRLENILHLSFERQKTSFVTVEKASTLERHRLNTGDVLFASFIYPDIRVCVFDEEVAGQSLNKADVFCVRPNQDVCTPRFLAYTLAAPQTYEGVKDAVHGSTRPRISLQFLKGLKIELPSMPEQAEIVRRLEASFAWLDRMAAEHARAKALLPHLDQAILARAFEGRLVPQDPNNEPASILLNRIKAERAATTPEKRGGGRLKRESQLSPVSHNRGRGQQKMNISNKKFSTIAVEPTSNSTVKTRFDNDVYQKPYLAKKIQYAIDSGLHIAKAFDPGIKQFTAHFILCRVYETSWLTIEDFYKQLAWEIQHGHIVHDVAKDELRAA